MRIVVLHFLDAQNQKHSGILKKLVEAASKNGHQVDLVNANTDGASFRITPYEYVAVVACAVSPFSGKISPQIGEVLSTCGTASGKKGCALVLKNLMFSQKACRNLMRAMEKEGMMIDYFEVIESADHANYVGKKLG